MGGASIIDQCLRKALVEELHLRIAPVLLGAGIALFDDLDHRVQRELLDTRDTHEATHLSYRVLA
jgi:dihydrofolate reductase